MTEANVKVVLLRARRKMKSYDKNRAAITPERQGATRRALEQFLLYLGTRATQQGSSACLLKIVSAFRTAAVKYTPR